MLGPWFEAGWCVAGSCSTRSTITRTARLYTYFIAPTFAHDGNVDGSPFLAMLDDCNPTAPP